MTTYASTLVCGEEERETSQAVQTSEWNQWQQLQHYN